MISKIKPRFIQIDLKRSQKQIQEFNLNTFRILNDNQEWMIDGQNFHSQKLSLLFRNSSKINIESLIMKQNQDPQIMYKIINPLFSILTQLKITGNNITSIQAIGYINAPTIQKLSISQNHIMSLAPLIKIISKNLHQISIEKNNLVEPYNFSRYLPRCLIGNKQKTLRMLKMQIKSLPQQRYSSIQCQDMSSLNKLNVQFLVEFKILNSQRITQQKVRQCRRRRNLRLMSQQLVSYS